MMTLSMLACVGAVLFLYSYIGYPLVLAFITRAKSKKPTPDQMPDHDWPKVGIIIAAYNEQKFIAQRIENILALDYPKDRLTLYLGSDGSKDQTPAIIQQFQNPQVVGRCFEQNRGKASVLNDLVASSNEEILAFSDANTFFEPDALKKLVTPFLNPAIGCVSGELNLVSAGGNNQDGLYWRIEQFLKERESRIHAALGANGAIYAIRRRYWQPLAPDTICDDFCIAMRVSARGGHIFYEPEAKAVEEMPTSVDDEYHRRIRIGIGNFQALFRNPDYLTATNWQTKWSYLSHKVLRWIGPHLLILSFIASCVAGYFNHDWLLWVGLQVFGVATGATVFVLQGRQTPLPKALHILGFVYALNAAFVIASWRYVTGAYSGSWRRTTR